MPLPEFEQFHMSFNLMPLLANRYILVIAQSDCVMLDTETDTWIKVDMPDVYSDLGGAVQIGFFPLPMHAYSSFAKARRHFERRDYFEMIFFGGVGSDLLSDVFHCSLTLIYSDTGAASGPAVSKHDVTESRQVSKGVLSL